MAGKCAAWQEDGFSPTPSSQGCSQWLLPVPWGWGCPSSRCAGLWVAAGCSLFPQPVIPAAPGTLAPFLKQLLSLGEGQQQGAISGWLLCADSGEWPATGVMPT